VGGGEKLLTRGSKVTERKGSDAIPLPGHACPPVTSLPPLDPTSQRLHICRGQHRMGTELSALALWETLAQLKQSVMADHSHSGITDLQNPSDHVGTTVVSHGQVACPCEDIRQGGENVQPNETGRGSAEGCFVFEIVAHCTAWNSGSSCLGLLTAGITGVILLRASVSWLVS
jgi:hypothetical protein